MNGYWIFFVWLIVSILLSIAIWTDKNMNRMLKATWFAFLLASCAALIGILSNKF